MTNLNKIKDKIKKLFALSKSPNANEAASALQMAQQLMNEYNLEAGDINLSDIAEEDLYRTGGQKPPAYEIALIQRIGDAYGCRYIYRWSKQKGYKNAYVIIGLESRAKIAAFLGTVMLRKLRNARSAHLKKLRRVRSVSGKTRRADAFCRGWVTIVVNKIQVFANSAEIEDSLDLYMKKYSSCESVSCINRSANQRYDDYMLGIYAASDVEIQHGVERGETGASLLEAI